MNECKRKYVYKKWQSLYPNKFGGIFSNQLRSNLESMDAAPEVPHPRPMRDAASDAVARASDRVCIFFFSLLGFAPTGLIRTDAARFVLNWLRFAPNRADSAKIGPYRPPRVISAGGWYGRYKPKNGRNKPETAEIGLEYGRKSRNLHSSLFFCESRRSTCFLKIF